MFLLRAHARSNIPSFIVTMVYTTSVSYPPVHPTIHVHSLTFHTLLHSPLHPPKHANILLFTPYIPSPHEQKNEAIALRIFVYSANQLCTQALVLSCSDTMYAPLTRARPCICFTTTSNHSLYQLPIHAHNPSFIMPRARTCSYIPVHLYISSFMPTFHHTFNIPSCSLTSLYVFPHHTLQPSNHSVTYIFHHSTTHPLSYYDILLIYSHISL